MVKLWLLAVYVCMNESYHLETLVVVNSPCISSLEAGTRPSTFRPGVINRGLFDFRQHLSVMRLDDVIAGVSSWSCKSH